MLYEDDGISMNYEKGEYLKTLITMSAGERTVLSFQHEAPTAPPLSHGFGCVSTERKLHNWITVDNQRFRISFTEENSRRQTAAGTYSQTLKSVQVKYPNPKKDYQVVVSFEQFDLIGM